MPIPTLGCWTHIVPSPEWVFLLSCFRSLVCVITSVLTTFIDSSSSMRIQREKCLFKDRQEYRTVGHWVRA